MNGHAPDDAQGAPSDDEKPKPYICTSCMS